MTATDGKKLTLTCSVHGLLHETTVYCQHESEDAIKSVGHAHGAVYGGGCKDGLLHVELLDIEPDGGETAVTRDRGTGRERPTQDRTR